MKERKNRIWGFEERKQNFMNNWTDFSPSDRKTQSNIYFETAQQIDLFFLFNKKQISIDVLDLICEHELKKRDLEIKACFYCIFRLFIMKCMSKISIE
jgi:hypothetical protein